MKKLLLVAVIGLLSLGANAQAQRYLNFGGLGTGLYVNYEIPLGSLITIAPAANTNYNFDNFNLGVRGNFYFDDLFGLTAPWDVYAGVGAGWRIDNNDNNNDGFSFGAQIGGRWFWNDRWGLNAEFGWNSVALGGVGVTLKM